MSTTTNAKPAQAVLGEMINGYWTTFAICIAAKLGVADRVPTGAAATHVDDLARTCEVNADALYRVLRALASLGVFREEEGRRFAHTPLSEALRSDVPGSMRGMAQMTLMLHLRAWPSIEHSLRTGETAFKQAFGDELFDYLEKTPDAGRVFDAAFGGYTATVSRAVAESHDFSRFERIVDVGGGGGALLAAVLAKAPKARGVNFDLGPVAARSRDSLAKAGLADRCDVVGGDFFAAVPEGGDAYLLKMIIHDWDDARSIAILKNVKKAMRPRASVFLIEAVVPTEGGAMPKLLDVNMLVMTGGRERTEAEYRTLLAAAGLSLERVTSAGPTNVIEAR